MFSSLVFRASHLFLEARQNNGARVYLRRYFIIVIFFFEGIPYITDCVMAEIEKLGSHYRVALR